MFKKLAILGITTLSVRSKDVIKVKDAIDRAYLNSLNAHCTTKDKFVETFVVELIKNTAYYLSALDIYYLANVASKIYEEYLQSVYFDSKVQLNNYIDLVFIVKKVRYTEKDYNTLIHLSALCLESSALISNTIKMQKETSKRLDKSEKIVKTISDAVNK